MLFLASRDPGEGMLTVEAGEEEKKNAMPRMADADSISQTMTAHGDEARPPPPPSQLKMGMLLLRR